MGTTYTQIFEIFATKIQDYTLDTLFTSSVTNYENYLLGFLKSAITNFNKCTQDLTNRDDIAKVFNITLTGLEQEILACQMTVEWMGKEIKNIRDMRLGLNDGDFKRYAESQNLKAKIDLQNQMIETVDKKIVEYGYLSYDFTIT